jgi:hypothetical protein
MNTSTYGGFTAVGRLKERGLYELCVYYAGSESYEASYAMAILMIF